MHVHVYAENGEAKFWLEPLIELAQNHGLSKKEINQLKKLAEEKRDEIEAKWRKHFGS